MMVMKTVVARELGEAVAEAETRAFGSSRSVIATSSASPFSSG